MKGENSAAVTLRLAGIVEDSIVDGPGLRLTVFVQGCPHGCPGCHNPQTHDMNGGRDASVAEILGRLDDNPLLSGVTLSGGEPFMQPLACAAIAHEAHSRGLNVWTYTGYTIEALLEMSHECGDVRTLLSETDVLVDGPFILAEKSLDCPWRGSKNQRLIDAKASLQAERAVLIEQRGE